MKKKIIIKGTIVNDYIHKSDCYLYKNDDIEIFIYDCDEVESFKEAIVKKLKYHNE